MINIRGVHGVWLKRLFLFIPLIILMIERSEAQSAKKFTQNQLEINKDGIESSAFYLLQDDQGNKWKLESSRTDFKIKGPDSNGGTLMRLIILNNGKIGINTPTPTVELEVDGTIKATTFDGDGSQLTGIDASQIANLPTGVGSSLWSENGSKIFYDQGRVGIGTTNPTAALEIKESVNTRIRVKSDVNTDGVDIGLTGDRLVLMNRRQGSDIDFLTNDGSITTKVKIKSNGNMGIGTTSPSEKLEVAGTVKASALHLHDVGLARMKFTSSTTGETANDGFHVGTSGTVDAIINNKEAGDLNIATNNLTRIVVKSDGRVGIGTTSPDEALVVAGNIKATEFIGNGFGLTTLNAANLTGVLPELDASNLMNIDAAQINNLSQDLQLNGTILTLGDSSSVDLANAGFLGTDNSLPINVTDGKIGIGTLTPERTFHFTRVGVDDGNDGGMRIDRSTYGPVLVMAKYPGGTPTNYLDNPGMYSPENVMIMRTNPNDFTFSYSPIPELGHSGRKDLLTIKKDGKIGIGKVNPSKKLDVDGTVKASAFVGDGKDITNINPDNITDLDARVSAVVEGNSLWSENSDKIFYNAGFVGIGKDNPTEALDIVGNIQATEDIQLNGTGTLNAIRADVDGTKHWIHFFGEFTGVEEHLRHKMNFHADSGITLGAWPNPIVNINNSNRSVGINLNGQNPTERLDVNGNVKATGFIGNGSALEDIDPDHITGLDARISAVGGFDGGLVNNNITIAAHQGLTIRNSEKGSLADPMVEGLVIYDRNFFGAQEPGGNYFDGDGGGLAVYNADDGWSAIVDTKNMKHLSAVFRSVVSTRFAVSANSSFDDWPDYVFDAEYELTPLEEVEAYISKNKHLPEVPSAADVAEEGIDLGNMDKTLLKKVEELTLYIIEQNKRIEQLEAKLADQ
ncbi:MAG: hypothetical protein R8G66_07835 [Cytophagales bacterium]|nr:hypothetical protein [Cytophagales bacterium]